MERADWSRIAHAGLEMMNPLPAAKLDEVLDVLGLERGRARRRPRLRQGRAAAPDRGARPIDAASASTARRR